jgi:tetratricopeptide (TPR) repeat protein
MRSCRRTRSTLRRELRESRGPGLSLAHRGRRPRSRRRSLCPATVPERPRGFFQGRIHEHAFGSLEPLWREWGLECRLGKTRLLHHGYTAGADTARAKAERNLRLLRLALDEQPDDVNLRMNLGLELTRTGQAEAGLVEYWRAFRLAERQPSVLSPELREALLTQLCTRLLGDGRAAEVPTVIESGLGRQHPLTASLHYLHGLACLELERWDDAIPAFRQCIALRAQPALTPAFAEIHGHAPEQALACCLTRTGRDAEAERILRDLIQCHPKSAEAIAALARFLAERESRRGSARGASRRPPAVPGQRRPLVGRRRDRAGPNRVP